MLLRAWPILLLLTGCADQGACQLRPLTQIPLAATGGHFYTQMGVNGHVATMMVDSGAFASMLTNDAVDRYGVRTTRTAATLDGDIEGIGGLRSFSVVAPDQVTLGRLSGSKFQLTSTDWTPPRSQPVTDGLIGADLLGRMDVDYDVLGGKLTLYKPSGRCTATPVLLTGDLTRVPMEHVYGKELRAFVSAKIDGQEFRALLDTGAQTSVMYRGAAARLGLDYDALAARAPVGKMNGIGRDKVGAVRHVFPEVELGELKIGNLPVEIIDESSRDAGMLLGQDFLRKVHVWVSNSDRALIFELPPKPSPPVEIAAH